MKKIVEIKNRFIIASHTICLAILVVLFLPQSHARAQVGDGRVVGCDIPVRPSRISNFVVCVKTAIKKKDGRISSLKKTVSSLKKKASVLVPDPTFISCVADKGMNFPNTVTNIKSDPSKYVLDNFIQTLTVATSAARIPASNSINDALRAREKTLDKVFEKGRLGSCTYAASKNARDAVRNTVVRGYPRVKETIESIVDKTVLPDFRARINKRIITFVTHTLEHGSIAASNTLAKGLGLTGVLLPEKLRMMVYPAMHEQLFSSKKMHALNVEINKLADLVVKGSSNEIKQQQRTVQRLLNNAANLSSRESTLIALDTLHLQVSHVAGIIGPAIFTRVWDKLVIAKDASAQAATGTVGTASQPAAGIAAVTAFALESAVPLARIKAKRRAAGIRQKMIDKFFNAAKKAAAEGKPLNYYSRNAGPLASLLKGMTQEKLLKAVSPELRDIEKGLFSYHKAVLKLSRAASGQ